jgi:hypothetical protein
MQLQARHLRGQHRLLYNRHIGMSRESTDCSRRVTLPEAAQAVVEQTSPEAAQAVVEQTSPEAAQADVE